MDTTPAPADQQLFAAMVAAASELQDPVKSKQGDSGRGTYRYASLGDWFPEVRRTLAKHDMFTTATVDGKAVVVTLYHKAGAKLVATCPMVGNVEQNMQMLGSGFTYARRYALTALLGLAPEDDDDGAAASGITHQAGGGQRQQRDNRPPNGKRERPSKDQQAKPAEPRPTEPQPEDPARVVDEIAQQLDAAHSDHGIPKITPVELDAFLTPGGSGRPMLQRTAVERQEVIRRLVTKTGQERLRVWLAERAAGQHDHASESAGAVTTPPPVAKRTRSTVQCSSCNADIQFVTNQKGTHCPVNLQEFEVVLFGTLHDAGLKDIEGQRRNGFVGNEDAGGVELKPDVHPELPRAKLRESHFATCPHSQSHRRTA